MNVTIDSFNLRHSCSHSCRYCSCPGVLGIEPAAYFTPSPCRPEILDRLQKDLVYFRPQKGNRALLSLVGDPYCPEEDEDRTTRQAIEIMTQTGWDIAILSKGGRRALRDLDLLTKGGDHLWGMSLVWMDDVKRAYWEPGAASVEERLEALQEAREAGLKTWVMVGPVIEPQEALAVITHVISCSLADQIWVEGLTGESSGEAGASRNFAAAAAELLHTWDRTGSRWRMKEPFASMLDPLSGGGAALG